jgi:hypothetical protein
MRVAGSGAERPAAPPNSCLGRRPPGVAPEGAAKAAGPSVTAGRSRNPAGAERESVRREPSRPI